MTNEQDNPADAEVLAALRQSTPGSSRAHDATIMAAARSVAGQRRRKARRTAPAWLQSLLVGVPALVLGVVVISRFDGAPAPTETVVRGAASDVLPADAARLDAAPERLRWSAVAGGDEYRVQLLDATASTIWSSDWQSATEVSLATAPTLSAGRYLWTVEVRNGRRGELGPYTFTIE